MKMNAETKVGAVTLVGIVLLIAIAMFYGEIRIRESGYILHVDFERVDGLKLGGQVRYAGVDVGRVLKLGMTDKGKARATLRIWTGNSIPTGSEFGIGSDGLLGDKFVNISPAAQRVKFFNPDDVVDGVPSSGLDNLISVADRLFTRMDKLVVSLEAVFGDPKVQGSLKDTTRNIDQLTASLSRMAVSNEQNINEIARNLLQMSASLRDVAARFDNEGKSAKDLTETLANLRNASARLEKMAAALEPVATDPETAGNLKTTLKNAREVSEKANRMLNKVEKIKTEAGVDLMYGGADRFRTNVDVRVHTDERTFAHMGLSDIGETNRVNFQIGQEGKTFGGRVGVIEGKVGAGLDLKLGRNFKFSADAYDPNDFRLKLRSEFRIAPDTYLVGESISINKDAQRSSYIGVRRTF